VSPLGRSSVSASCEDSGSGSSSGCGQPAHAQQPLSLDDDLRGRCANCTRSQRTQCAIERELAETRGELERLRVFVQRLAGGLVSRLCGGGGGGLGLLNLNGAVSGVAMAKEEEEEDGGGNANAAIIENENNVDVDMDMDKLWLCKSGLL